MEARHEEANHHEAHQAEQEVYYWTKYLNYQSDWLEKTRGNLMVVATVIATMSFQIAVNPPGGAWQANQTFEQGCPLNNQTCMAGTSILAYTSRQTTYNNLLISSTVSFSASLSVIFLLIIGLPLKNRFVTWVLILSMSTAVLFMVATYILSVNLVRAPHDKTVDSIVLVYILFWVLFLSLIVLVVVLRFLFWLLKKLIMCIAYVICCYPFRHRHEPTRGANYNRPARAAV